MKKTKNAKAVNTIPKTIFAGVEGSSPFLSSHLQSVISGKVRTITHPGLIAFEMMPVTFQLDLLKA